MSHADLQTYLVELLMKQDQMSMAASIESRVPFLDHELVEHVVRDAGRVQGPGLTTKAVLREALRERVPREILTGASWASRCPSGRWAARAASPPSIRTTILGPRALARGLFDPAPSSGWSPSTRAAPRNHADRLWLLLNLEIWQRIFLDGEEPATVPSGV